MHNQIPQFHNKSSEQDFAYSYVTLGSDTIVSVMVSVKSKHMLNFK